MIIARNIQDVIEEGFEVMVYDSEVSAILKNPNNEIHICIDYRNYLDSYSNSVMRSTTGSFEKCAKAFKKYTESKVDKYNKILK